MSGFLQGLVWAADFAGVEVTAGNETRTITISFKAPLARLADACNDYGEGVRALGRDMIAEDCLISTETLRKALRVWRELGILEIEDPAKGRGNRQIYSINVGRLADYIPAERLPSGLQKIWDRRFPGQKVGEKSGENDPEKGVQGDQSEKKGVQGDRVSGPHGPEKGVQGDRHTNNTESNKTLTSNGEAPSAARADASPPSGRSGRDRSPEEMERLRLAERRIILKWIRYGTVDRSDTFALDDPLPSTCYEISKQRATHYVLQRSPQSLKKVESWIVWAMNIMEGKDQTKPIPQVESMIEDYQKADEITVSRGREKESSGLRERSRILLETVKRLRKEQEEALEKAENTEKRAENEQGA